MLKISESQFLDLCNLYKRPLPLIREDRTGIDRLKEWGLIALESGEWSLTERGRSFIDGKGLELSKPDFGNLTASEKKAIIATGIFPEHDRRRLMFDPTESVAMRAVNCFDPTEEEFIQLGASPSPAVRAEALSKGEPRLWNRQELDRKLARYLEHDDKETVKAVLETLRATGNIGFVDEDLIARWLGTDTPDADVLQMLCQNQIKVPDSTIASLLDQHDPDVIEIMSAMLLDRLDSAQVDTILAHGSETARIAVANHGENLTASQVKRLLKDDEDMVSWATGERLLDLENALRMVEKDPKLVAWIQEGGFHGNTAS